MIELRIDTSTLETLLQHAGAARWSSVTCEWGERLRLQLIGLDTGVAVLGRKLPRVDVELFLTAREIGAQTVEIDWTPGKIGGVPGFATKLVPKALVGKKALEIMTERLDLADSAQVLEDGRVLVHLERLPFGPPELMGELHCEKVRVPGEVGVALDARLDV